MGNQAGIEKYATGTNSTQNAPEDDHTEDIPQRGPHVAPPQNPTKASRQKWSREEYKEVMEAFYTASLNPNTSVIQGTYDIWRASNPTNRLNLDANKLANVHRDILNKKRLTEMELQAIQAKVIQRDANVIPDERDVNADPEEQNEDKNENEKNNEPDGREPLNEDEQDEKVRAMKESILRKYEAAKETPIGQRPPLPKIKSDRHSKSATEIANKVINQIKDQLPEVLSLTDINHLIYASASAITESLGIKEKRKYRLRKDNRPKWKKKLEI